MQIPKHSLLLKALEKNELKAFKLFLQGFYGGQKKILSLYNTLLENSPNYNISALQLSKVISTRDSNDKVSEKTIKNRLATLSKYLEEFLIWKKVKSESYEKDKIILDIYKERELATEYEKKMEKLKEDLNIKHKNMWTYLKLFELHYISYLSTSNDKKTINGNEMDTIMANLDGFFISAKLKLACEQGFRKKIFGQELDIKLLDQTSSLALQEDYQKNNLIKISQMVLALIHQSNFKEYTDLKKLIKENYMKEEDIDKSILYGFLMNYISSEAKNEGFDDEASEWVRFGLEKELVFDGKYIMPSVFLNLFYTSCRIKDDLLRNEILEKFSSKLKNKEKDDTLLIANALLSLEKKEYDKIILNLNKNKIVNRVLNLRARFILLRAYTGKREFRKLYDFVKASYNSVMKATDLGKENKISATNTFKYAEKIMNPNIDAIAIKEEIEDNPLVFGKSWLLELLKEFHKI